MISEKLQNAINEQITAEMWSSNLYLSMSFYSCRKKVSTVLLHGCVNSHKKNCSMLMI